MAQCTMLRMSGMKTSLIRTILPVATEHYTGEGGGGGGPSPLPDVGDDSGSTQHAVDLILQVVLQALQRRRFLEKGRGSIST